MRDLTTREGRQAFMATIKRQQQWPSEREYRAMLNALDYAAISREFRTYTDDEQRRAAVTLRTLERELGYEQA